MQNRRWVCKVSQRWSWANSVSESAPSAPCQQAHRAPAAAQGTVCRSSPLSSTYTPQRQVFILFHGHTSSGVYLPSLVPVPVLRQAGTAWKSHLPTVLPAVPGSCTAGAEMSRWGLFIWKSAAHDYSDLQPCIYLQCWKYNPLPYQRSICSGCKEAADLTWIKVMTHHPTPTRDVTF